MENIFWEDVRNYDDVVLDKHMYVVNGDHVAYWAGSDAKKAQDRLDWLVRQSEERAKQGLPRIYDVVYSDHRVGKKGHFEMVINRYESPRTVAVRILGFTPWHMHIVPKKKQLTSGKK